MLWKRICLHAFVYSWHIPTYKQNCSPLAVRNTHCRHFTFFFNHNWYKSPEFYVPVFSYFHSIKSWGKVSTTVQFVYKGVIVTLIELSNITYNLHNLTPYFLFVIENIFFATQTANKHLYLQCKGIMKMKLTILLFYWMTDWSFSFTYSCVIMLLHKHLIGKKYFWIYNYLTTGRLRTVDENKKW